MGRISTESKRPARLSAILRLLAAQPASEFVQAKLAREAKISESTARDYFDALDRKFLLSTSRPWTPNLTKREIGKPKVWSTDSGFAAYLAGLTMEKYVDISQDFGFGHSVEALILQELQSQRGWSDTEYELYHWRDRSGKEIDTILELVDGSIIVIEIKSGQQCAMNISNIYNFSKINLAQSSAPELSCASLTKTSPLVTSFMHFQCRLWVL